MTQIFLDKLKSGDEKSYEQLFNQKYPDAYRLALSYCHDYSAAEDIAQEAFIKLFKNINSLSRIEAFNSWFNTIVVNTAKNYCIKNNKNPYTFSQLENEENGVEFDELIENNNREFNPEDVADQKEIIKMMAQIMSEISDDQRLCLQLFYYNNMKIKEISQSLDIPENTVKTRLRRGKDAVEAKVKEYEKKGYSLRGVSVIPFFFSKSFANTVVPATSFGTVVAPAVLATTGVSTAVGAATKLTAGVIIRRVVAGILVSGIIAGGTGVAVKQIKDKNDTPITTTQQAKEKQEANNQKKKEEPVVKNQRNLDAIKQYLYADYGNKTVSSYSVETEDSIFYAERDVDDPSNYDAEYFIYQIDKKTNERKKIYNNTLQIENMAIHDNKLYFTLNIIVYNGQSRTVYGGALYVMDLNNISNGAKRLVSEPSLAYYDDTTGIFPFSIIGDDLFYLSSKQFSEDEYGFVLVKYDLSTNKIKVIKNILSDNSESYIFCRYDSNGEIKYSANNSNIYENDDYVVIVANKDRKLKKTHYIERGENEKYVFVNKHTGEAKILNSDDGKYDVKFLGINSGRLFINRFEPIPDTDGGYDNFEMINWDDLEDVEL